MWPTRTSPHGADTLLSGYNATRNPQSTRTHTHTHTHTQLPPPRHTEPPSPVELPLKGIQPALHVAPGPPAGAGQGDVQEAGGGGRAARQLLVLAAPTVPPEAEDVGHS